MDTQLLLGKREILNISVVVKKGEELIKSFDFFIQHKENAQFKKFIRGRDLIRQISHGWKYIPKRRRFNLETNKDKIVELNLLVELDTDNQSYQEIKDAMIQYITQLELKIADYIDRLDYLNKVVEILLNLDNSPPEIRRLARYDYLKMNLTSAVTLEQEVKECQELMTTSTRGDVWKS